jgi:uncharacterized membrane protein
MRDEENSMAEPTPVQLEERVTRLERMVEELVRASGAEPGHVAPADQNTIAHAAAIPSPASVSPGRRSADVARSAGSAAERAIPAWQREVWNGEFWLNKIGIGLVLFGMTFLFRYSIEQGWLTPEVRVVFGASVGAVLLAAGLRLGDEQRSLAQVLLGGGIGVFYIVVFSAFQLYGLLGYNTAFAAMVAVTVLAFALAVRDDQPWLALIGAKGGLGTPFLLYTGGGDLLWLVGYTTIIVAASTGLVVLRGWRGLLWTVVLGGWAVHLVAYVQSIAPAGLGTEQERWAIQGTVVILWTLFAIVVPAWEHRSGWEVGSAGAGQATRWHRGAHLHLLAAVTGLALLGMTVAVWQPAAATWGWAAIAIGAAYAASCRVLLGRDGELARAQLFAGSVLIAIGCVAALGGERLYVSLAALALLFHLAARRLGSGWQAALGHSILAALAMWFIVRLDSGGISGSWRALADPLVIGAAFLAAREVREAHPRRFYRTLVHIAILAFLWRELNPLVGGAALVSSAWGAYALGLLGVGVTRNLQSLQKIALLTILLVVAKLFLVDLAALEALWRILLFLGLGSLLLLASYGLRGAWRAAALRTER